MKLFILFLCFIPSLVFGEVFSIIQMTDTHDTNAQKITAYNTWILANDAPEERNIKFVVHSGDLILNDNSTAEINASATGMKQLEDIVPYLVIQGNHDYNFPPFQYGLLREATKFDAAYPESDFNLKGYFGGNYNNSMRNNYGLFTVDGQEYMMLGLEFCPLQVAADWADGVLNTEVTRNPNIIIIVFTHYHIKINSKQVIPAADGFDSGGCWAGAVNGRKLYDEVLSKYPNIVLVLSGHTWLFSDLNGSAKEQTMIDNKIMNHTRINFQQWPSNQDRVLRIWTFDTDNTDIITAETWSVSTSAYLTDKPNAFTLRTTVLPITDTDGIASEGLTITKCGLN